MGEVAGIGLVAAVLEPVVLLDGQGVHQMNLETLGHQPIDQPVPIESGFDRNTGDLLPPGGKNTDNLGKIVGKTFLHHDTIRVIHHGYHAVVRMQVNSAIFHFGLLSAKAGSQTHFSPAPSRRREAG